jgi:glutathione synthase/RimK-type ligase-like ATP-grasp enzyme
MNSKPDRIMIAIGKDNESWYKRFEDALSRVASDENKIEFDVLDLDRHDWIEKIHPYDVILWKPSYMGPRSSAQFQAKVYFMERYCKKLVVPNYDTIWHFENKIAQHYLFEKFKIPTPETTVTFNYQDAIAKLAGETWPLVFKEPYGAGSVNVKMVDDFKTAKNVMTETFSHQLWMQAKPGFSSMLMFALSNVTKPWFRKKIKKKIFDIEYFEAAYWQKYIPGNDSDLRITVIGNKYAFGFWRKNRKNDFRASGSGMLDYEKAVPEEAVKMCLRISRELNFDSMAYDILIDGSSNFLISEMSYGYLDRAIFNASGVYESVNDGGIEFKKGNFWPQEIWIKWALYKIQTLRQLKDNI